MSNNNIVRIACEVLSWIMSTSFIIINTGNCCIQIQITSVIFHIAVGWYILKIDIHISKTQIISISICSVIITCTYQVSFCKISCRIILAFRKVLMDWIHCRSIISFILQITSIVILSTLTWSSWPKWFLIQLDTFSGNPTEYGSTDSSITHRKWLFLPAFVILGNICRARIP